MSTKIISFFTSLKFTVFCMALAMALVFIGTIAQVDMGTFAAQRKFFNHFFVYGPEIAGFRIPVFPGGLLVGMLWFVNLVFMLTFRMRYHKKTSGLVLIHLGLLTMLVGQLYTQLWAHESRMAVQEGETKNYIESSQAIELAVVMVSEPQKDFLVSIPPSYFNQPGVIATPHLPFEIHVKSYFANSVLRMKRPDEAPVATQGVGSQLMIDERPFSTKDNETNNTAIVFEIISAGKSLGTWVAAIDLGSPQPTTIDGKTYQFFVRPKRTYLPYSLTLKDFRHDRYPGTQIPKNFSSLVQINNPEHNENRDVLIYMNNPLRYEGLTFYQASFANEDTISIFQVVDNRAWLAPYISCIMVALGLCIQFFMHLSRFSKRRV